VGEVVAEEMVRYTVLIPYERGDLVELFHRRGHVMHQAPEETGTQLSGTLPRQIVPIFAPYRAHHDTEARPTRARRGAAAGAARTEDVPRVPPAAASGAQGIAAGK